MPHLTGHTNPSLKGQRFFDAQTGVVDAAGNAQIKFGARTNGRLIERMTVELTVNTGDIRLYVGTVGGAFVRDGINNIGFAVADMNRPVWWPHNNDVIIGVANATPGAGVTVTLQFETVEE